MLTSTLMESAFGGVPNNVAPELLSKYTHEDGATLIAMESAEDIRDIFFDSVYTMEALEFERERATMEGASEDVMEAIGEKIKTNAKAAISTIKTKLKQLWEKVKGFTKNVKTRLLSIFQNASKFAKNNKDMLKKLDLAGFEYEVFPYRIENACNKMTTAIKTESDSAITYVGTLIKNPENGEERKDLTGDGSGQYRDNYDLMLKSSFGGSDKEEDVTKYIWGQLRGGVQYGADKEQKTGDINDIVDALIGAPKLIKSFDSTWSKQDDMFKKAITKCNEGERLDTGKYPHLVKTFQQLHTLITKYSNLFNKVIGQAKSAVDEMIGDYMRVVRKALRYKPAKKD